MQKQLGNKWFSGEIPLSILPNALQKVVNKESGLETKLVRADWPKKSRDWNLRADWGIVSPLPLPRNTEAVWGNQ